jgi:hypothetical protein
VSDWEVVGLGGCRIGRLSDWEVDGLGGCRIGRLSDWEVDGLGVTIGVLRYGDGTS